MSKSPITTHILDTSLGRPAAGVSVRLERLGDGGAAEVGQGTTDADGRITDLLEPGSLTEGTYRITFATGDYFASQQRPCFYPSVSVVFLLEAPDEHYHVPLLLNPFGYSTYRGS